MKKRAVTKIYKIALSSILIGLLFPMSAYCLGNTQEIIDRKYELCDLGYSGKEVADQLSEEFDHVDGPYGTGGIDGLLLNGTPANSTTTSTETPESKPNQSVSTTPVVKHTHSWESEITKEATCIEKGEITYKCTGCKETYTEGIPLTEHDWNATDFIPATCKNIALTTFTCSVCGEIDMFEDGDLLDHIYIKTNDCIEPTCENSGHYIYKCNVCEDTYEEDVEALGHDWNDEYTVDLKATCVEEGKKSIHCNRCDVIKEGSEIDLVCLGHTEEHEITEPTFNTEGSEIIKCTTCGVVLDTITLPATGKATDIIIPIIIVVFGLCIVVGIVFFIRKITKDKHPIKTIKE